ncbi:hypothetical protein V8E53_008300 [Lactarius tabidus]
MCINKTEWFVNSKAGTLLPYLDIFDSDAPSDGCGNAVSSSQISFELPRTLATRFLCWITSCSHFHPIQPTCHVQEQAEAEATVTGVPTPISSSPLASPPSKLGVRTTRRDGQVTLIGVGKTGDFPHPADSTIGIRTLTCSFNPPPTAAATAQLPQDETKLVERRNLGGCWAVFGQSTKASLSISVAVDSRWIFRIDVCLASHTPI